MSLTEIIRLIFLVTAGVYFGIAYAVLAFYFGNAPTSNLRRLHVIGVSLGTSLLVVGFAGGVYEKMQDNTAIVWYGAPIGFAGVVCVTVALFILNKEQRYGRRKGQSGPNYGRRAVDRDPSA